MLDPLTLRMVQAALNTLLTDSLIAAGTNPKGVFNTVYLGLFTAWPGFNLTRVRADLTEASYTGYVRQLVVWGTPTFDPNGRPSVYGGGLTFESTDAVTPNTVIGAALYDAATNGNLLALAAFNNPVALAAAGNAVDITPKLAIPGTEAPDWGVGSVLQ